MSLTIPEMSGWPPFAAALLALALGCSTPQSLGEDGSARAGAETDQQRITRLEREARALARAEGCQGAGDCRTAPVGSRPCGGPRTYVVYCARTTDSAALYRKLDELARAERANNEKQGLMSTCEFRMPPAVTTSGGSCHAAP